MLMHGEVLLDAGKPVAYDKLSWNLDGMPKLANMSLGDDSTPNMEEPMFSANYPLSIGMALKLVGYLNTNPEEVAYLSFLEPFVWNCQDWGKLHKIRWGKTWRYQQQIYEYASEPWFSVRARSGFPRAQEIIDERYYTWSQPKPKRPLIRACCNEAGMQASDEATLMDEVEASCQQCYSSSSGKSDHWKHWNLSRGTSAMPHFTGWKYIIYHGHGGHGGASGESITSREVWAACGQTRAQEWNLGCAPLRS